jgi:transposase
MGATCGIDWASESHDLHIAGEQGQLLAGEQFSHDERGVSALIELLLGYRVECCAIERPDWLLVGRLLAAGIVVLAIHPNQVKATRNRDRAAAGSIAAGVPPSCSPGRTTHPTPSSGNSSSVVTAAGLLAEIGGNRARYPTNDSLAADSGQAPVTIQSGKLNSAAFRWACDKRLRSQIGVLADSTRYCHRWAKDVYTRGCGCDSEHPHAIRTPGRAWTRVLWRCWQDHRPCDPTIHNALNKTLATNS